MLSRTANNSNAQLQMKGIQLIICLCIQLFTIIYYYLLFSQVQNYPKKVQYRQINSVRQKNYGTQKEMIHYNQYTMIVKNTALLTAF